jgi:hypothetical protein
VRKLERREESLVEAREKLARLEPGGSSERPIEVETAALIELRAEAMPCLRCNGQNRCAEHLAIDTERGLVREVHLVCRACGTLRTVYFRVAVPLLN